MAMIAGNVSIAVNSDGSLTVTKSGAAEARYDMHVTRFKAALAQSGSKLQDNGWIIVPGVTTPMSAQAQLQGLADLSNDDAGWIIGYLTAHAVPSVVVSLGGLQRTPNPNDPNVATAAPAAPVTLTGTLA